mgnify:CR=1 FL=1
MLSEERTKAKTEIWKNVTEFSGETRWKWIPNSKVIKMGTKFCDELINLADTLEDEHKVHCTALFANVVLVFVAETRYYDEISEEELEAISKIFDELRVLRDEFLCNGLTDDMFDKIMYIRDIFLTNTVCREDYDCKYRQGMPFPNFVDLYKIVYKLNRNWDMLVGDERFKRKKIEFFELRHFGTYTIGSDERDRKSVV